MKLPTYKRKLQNPAFTRMVNDFFFGDDYALEEANNLFKDLVKYRRKEFAKWLQQEHYNRVQPPLEYEYIYDRKMKKIVRTLSSQQRLFVSSSL